MLEGGPGLQAGQGRPGGPKEKAGRIEGEGREDRRGRHGVSGRPGGQPSPEVSEPRASPHEGSSEESSSCPGLVRGLMFCEVLLLFFPTLSYSHVVNWDLLSLLEEARVTISAAFQGPSTETKSVQKYITHTGIAYQIVKFDKSSKVEFNISVSYEVHK